MTERYEVRIERQNEQGYWQYDNLLIDVPCQRRTKNQHGKAELLARERYPGCKVLWVKYV
jgi:hypothetical protein